MDTPKKDSENALPINSIINGDCIDVMSKLPDESIDFIFSDPPYGIALEKRATTEIKKFRHSTINTIMVSDWDRDIDYLDFTRKWMKEAYRILKPKSWICVWNDYRRIKDIHQAAEELGLRIADIFVWAKRNPPLGFPDGFTKSCEFCLIFNKTSDNKDYKRFMSKTMHKNYILTPLCPLTEREEGSYHPTIKPRQVLKPFIDKFSKPNDVVLDCFSGSGSIPVTAMLMKRNFIGIEKDENYYKQSIKRINDMRSKVQTDLMDYGVKQ